MRVYSLTDFIGSSDIPFFIDKGKINSDFPVHTHDFDEIMIVFDGSGIHTIDGYEYPISKGDVFFINGSVTHGFVNCEQLIHSNIILKLDHSFFASAELKKIPGFIRLFVLEHGFRKEHNFESRLSLNNDELKFVEKLVSELINDFSKHDENSSFVIYNSINYLLIYLSKCYLHNLSIENSFNVQLNDFAKVMDFIDNNYKNDISLDMLAKMSNYSKRHFSRVFQNIYKITPIEYIINLRIQSAAQMLKNTDISITDIASINGFNNISYFHKLIKKKFSMTPTELRKHLINENSEQCNIKPTIQR